MGASKPKDEDTRARLLSAAGPVFAAQGFEKATVREICSRADVNIASVGYYFGDKLGLYREVLRTVREDKSRRFPIPEADAHDSAEQRLLEFVRTLLRRMLSEDEEGWQVQLLMREMDRPTSALGDIVDDHFQPVFNELRETLRALLSDPISVPALDHFALSVIGQCFHYRVGTNTIHRIISPQSRALLNDIDALASHITGVTLAVVRNQQLIETQREDGSTETSSLKNQKRKSAKAT